MIDTEILNYVVTTLEDADKPAMISHLLRLNKTDRYMRFFAAISDSLLISYISKLDLQKSKVFGIYNEDRSLLVAFVHVSEPEKNKGRIISELGISVNESHRGLGLARRLMDRSVTYCRANDIDTLFISCLRENRKMQAMATNAGLKVVLDHGEAIANLELDEMNLPKQTAISQEIAYQQISTFDKCYRHNSTFVESLMKHSK